MTVNKSKSQDYTAKLSTKFNKTTLDQGEYNLKPGQVLTYSWYTYYLNTSIGNFDAFFNQVVDQVWLNDGSKEAETIRGLSQARNPVWRITHIVDEIQRKGPRQLEE